MFFVERFIILCPYYGGPLSEVPLFLVNMKVENVPAMHLVFLFVLIT